MNSSSPLSIELLFTPELDAGLKPASKWNREFRKLAEKEGAVPLRLALERADGSVSRFDTIVFAEGSAHFDLNLRYAERLVKFLLWQRGGWKVYCGGPAAIGEYLKRTYAVGGEREFDAKFMGEIYEHPFTVEVTTADAVPEEKETTVSLGRHLDGCRVGFDLGASDRKASAVLDGEVIYSEEVPWDPRLSLIHI